MNTAPVETNAALVANVAGCGILSLLPPDALIFRPLLNFIVATAPVSCANATTSALVRLNIQLWPVQLCARLLSTARSPQSLRGRSRLVVDECKLLGSFVLPSDVNKAQIYRAGAS